MACYQSSSICLFLFVLKLCQCIPFDSSNYSLKQTLAECQSNGTKSFKDALNCSNFFIDETMDPQIQDQCRENFLDGCSKEQIKHYCYKGANNFINGINSNCFPLIQKIVDELDSYEICCNVCKQGFIAYENNEGNCYKERVRNRHLEEMLYEGVLGKYVEEIFDKCCLYPKIIMQKQELNQESDGIIVYVENHAGEDTNQPLCKDKDMCSSIDDYNGSLKERPKKNDSTNSSINFSLFVLISLISLKMYFRETL